MLRGEWKLNACATGKFPKWIGLTRPVQTVRAFGILLQRVFATLVIIVNVNLTNFHLRIVRYVDVQYRHILCGDPFSD